MIYCAALLFSFGLGFLLLRRLNIVNLSSPLTFLFSAALGFGIASYLVFYPHILLNIHMPYLPVILGFIFLLIVQKKNLWSTVNFTLAPGDLWGIAALGGLAIALFIEANAYPYGGWDAWSSWNLKAKFIYLGKEHWKTVLDPILWRSNTHYPLFLPGITVWSWNLMGAATQWVPMVNSILFTLVTAGILIFGIRALIGQIWTGIILCLALFTVPLVITLAVSQYSDILFALYFLASLVCFLLGKKSAQTSFFILAAIFIGFLSFTKIEGAVASIILSVLMVWNVRQDRKLVRHFVVILVLSSLPTILFQMFLSPPNAAFFNGLTSSVHPSTLARLSIIIQHSIVEIINFKWNGLFILIVVGIACASLNAFSRSVRIIPLALVLYLGVVFVYYQVNTFFEITWWIQTTLHRILFALLPSLMLWVGITFKKDA